ncbi:MAG: aldo/keto reductase [Candidatus Eremiobacteraeota bacterium]|nr:aldo/keto reductase [Candidatus Eremiobacteraeota bacterium]MCW5872887.1 aldo/keto reductase [Candidatus Eremiobacteraeota bacterium]
MSDQPAILLNDTKSIPQMGLGVWQTPNDTAVMAVETALRNGYRHVDTASIYGNEQGVGDGLRASGIPRHEIFLTTKLWNDDQGFDSALRACEASLKKLGTDYVDLYLIHWPSPHRNLYLDSWRALVRLREEGRVRSIGVSNFGPAQLQRIIGETGVKPVLNQVELHPRFQQRELREFHHGLQIATQSWSPLGQGQLLNDPVVQGIAAKHGKSAAQVVIRWHLDHDFIVIPKSVTPLRIAENFAVFDFRLDESDRLQLDALDSAEGRIGPNPQTATF